MNDTSYVKALPEAGNRLRIQLGIDRDIVQELTVQYEVDVNGQWRPVVRYDTSHGRFHRNILDRHGNEIEKQWLDEYALNDGLQFARDDLDRNWRAYRDAFFRRHR